MLARGSPRTLVPLTLLIGMSLGALYALHTTHISPHSGELSSNTNGIPMARRALAAPQPLLQSKDLSAALSRSPEGLSAGRGSRDRDLEDRVQRMQAALGAHGETLENLVRLLAERDRQSEARLEEALAKLHAAVQGLPQAVGDAAAQSAERAAKEAMTMLSEAQHKAHTSEVALGGASGGNGGGAADAGAKDAGSDGNDGEQQALDANGDPKPRTPFFEFLGILRAHLSGSIEHDVMLEFLGVDVKKLAAVRPWARQPLQAQAEQQDSDAHNADQSAKVRAMLIEKGFLQAPEEEGGLVGQISLAVWAPKRCLEQNETQNGEAMVLRPCSLGGSFQQWKLRRDGRISGGLNPMGQDCLAMPRTTPGANVETADCDAEDDAQVFSWRVQGPDRQVGELVHVSSGLCVGVDDARPESELPLVQAQECGRRCNQLWTVDSKSLEGGGGGGKVPRREKPSGGTPWSRCFSSVGCTGNEDE